MRLIHFRRAFSLVVITASTVGLTFSHSSAPGQELPLLDLSGIGETSGEQPYVALGRLERVQNESSNVQRLAVIGDEGEVQAFLAPTARMDLRSYLGKRVGVSARTVTEDREGGPPYVIVDRLVSLPAGMQSSTPRPSNAGRERGPRPTLAANRPVGSAVRQVSFDEAIRGNSARPRQFPGGQGLKPVQHEEPIIDEGPVYEDWQIVDGGGGGLVGGVTGGFVGETCDGNCGGTCSFDGCTAGGSCGAGCQGCAQCGPPGWLWVRAEYMLMFANGMYIPPLVTTGGATPAVIGVLGQPDTSVLLGNQDILDGERSGFRIKFGGYWGPRRCLMWEGEYLGLGSQTMRFEASSDTNPTLARPFFNINPRDGNGNLLPAG
ncbi:MAG: BBP7 family outer membrane beta-barrel protein, partial [Planctomycetales bacterium]|nr:BBP7 family outer membrane beta-barrel protein [Planctomycetales bacterium]